MARRANGEGTISQRKDRAGYEGKVIAGYNPDGTPIRKTVYDKTKKGVAAKMALVKADISKYGVIVARAQKNTFETIVKAWVVSLETRAATNDGIQLSTINGYEMVANVHLMPKLNGIDIRKIDRAAVDTLNADLLGLGKSINTMRQILFVLRSVFKFAVDRGYIGNNPAQWLKLPKADNKNAKEKHFEAHEIKAIKAAVAGDRVMKLMFFCLFYIGMRRGEVAGLKWADVDFEGKRIFIARQTIVKNSATGKAIIRNHGKTENSGRVWSLSGDLIVALKRHKIEQSVERLKWGADYYRADYVFAKEDGTPYSPDVLTRKFKRILERLSIDSKHRVLHAGRHSAATIAINAGENVVDVAAMLGHSKPSFTLNTYSHAFTHQKEQSANNIELKINELIG
ncbi:MAG: tyrosine-type recombinase/integrase [Bacillota bacterium]